MPFRGFHVAAFSRYSSNHLRRFLFPFHRRSQHSLRMSSDSSSPYEDFFRYTGGRWLWDEENQLRKRYHRFNVLELQRLAATSVNAQACVSMTKLAEGRYNKVFRLLMDNDIVVIARLPNANCGPSFLTTASEVATMEFVGYLRGFQLQDTSSYL
jgi:hypothetical protein